jgi:membrane-bound serine protease (ClpP class)
MDPLEALWHRLLDPSTAYVLFVLGLYALFAEVAHPGAILPGTTGVITLGLASIAFASLPVNWIGVAVVVVGVVLMGVELKAPTHGLLTLAGLAGLVAGSELLYAAPGSLAPIVTELTVAPVVLGGTVLVGLGVGLTFARIARRIRTLPPIISLEQLVGARGVSRSGLDPEGVVHVQGQLWSARARGPHLGPGEPVRVLARHGLILEVESAARRSAATQKGAVQ